MTCIYDAWSEALRIGHDQIQLKKEPILQQTMFDEYVHVDGDNMKAEKNELKPMLHINEMVDHLKLKNIKFERISEKVYE